MVQGRTRCPTPCRTEADRIGREGGTPLLLAVNREPVGLIELKDILKEGMTERFEELRRMGIRTVMITGDNPLTAEAIAREAGVDDFLAEAKPQDKLDLIKREQEGGRLVAMIGDGTNDAPALAQADVGVAMNAGTQAAKEAGNMVDLDSNPTKLLDVVEVGKQLLITRGALTTFSIANDVAKYFAIIPAMFAPILPALDQLNVLRLDDTAVGHPVRGHLQCARDPGADPACAARGSLPTHAREHDAAAQPRDLRPRRADRSIRRHQAHRPGPVGGDLRWSRLCAPCERLLVFTVLTGIVYPLVFTLGAQVVFLAPSRWVTGRSRGRDRRQRADRPGLGGRGVVLRAPIGSRLRRVRVGRGATWARLRGTLRTVPRTGSSRSSTSKAPTADPLERR